MATAICNDGGFICTRRNLSKTVEYNLDRAHLNDSNEKIGTIEMFHRIADDEFNHYGVLRIDLQSDYETQSVIEDILEIANENFYKTFDVKAILTKAIPNAIERVTSLLQKGYHPLNRKLMIYDDYFVNYENK